MHKNYNELIQNNTMRIPTAGQSNKTKSITNADTHVEQDKAFFPKSKGQNCI
jgi:hypothetical protein